MISWAIFSRNLHGLSYPKQGDLFPENMVNIFMKQKVTEFLGKYFCKVNHILMYNIVYKTG